MINNPHTQSHMKYGQIAGSKRINEFIYYCFDHVCEEDQRKFVKQFREKPHDSDQIMHTFRELILGAYLSIDGLQVRHDYAVDNKTPDWCILNDESSVIGIVELTNFHIDDVTKSEIRKQRETKRFVAYWRDGNKDNVERLYRCIDRKAQTYRSLAKSLNVPFVVAVFGGFEAAVDLDEVCRCLLDEDAGLFDIYPEMSGVLYFKESSGRYLFTYAQNPNASYPIKLPTRSFPSEAP